MAKDFVDKQPCPRCGQQTKVAERRVDEGAVVLACGCKFGKASLSLMGYPIPGEAAKKAAAEAEAKKAATAKAKEKGETVVVTKDDIGTVEAVTGKLVPK